MNRRGTMRTPIVIDDDLVTIAGSPQVDLANDFFDLTEADEPPLTPNSPQKRPKKCPRRSIHAEPPLFELSHCFIDHNKEELFAGDCVEYTGSTSSDRNDLDLQKTDFLHIISIVCRPGDDDDETPKVTLRGHRLRRTMHYRGFLHQTFLNELCLDLEVDEDDSRPIMEQSIEEIDLRCAFKKRDLVITSKPFPELSWRCGPDAIPFDKHSPDADVSKDFIFHCGRLTVRTIVTKTFKNATARLSAGSKPCGGGLLHVPLQPPERQTRISTPLRSTRGSPEYRRNLASSRELPHKLKKPTVIDVFCGAGGASAGARMAGFQVVAGVDCDAIKMSSWKANNPGGTAYVMGVDIFIATIASSYAGKVDVLHVSPPCQPYSPAHTIPGANDEKNEAALFSVGELIRILKPTIVTLEETAGLFTRHQTFFQALVAQFHANGYDCQWSKPNLAVFGVPQKTRDRLLFTAVQHGKPMPSWPKPTHGNEESGLQPFSTIRSAIRHLTSHDSLMEHSPPRGGCTTADLDQPLQNCITTAGPLSNHPAGRAFTVREAACLQTFSTDYELKGSRTEMLTQIGNAFPPKAAKALFVECIKVLRSNSTPSGSPAHTPPSRQERTPDKWKTPHIRRPQFLSNPSAEAASPESVTLSSDEESEESPSKRRAAYTRRKHKKEQSSSSLFQRANTSVPIRTRIPPAYSSLSSLPRSQYSRSLPRFEVEFHAKAKYKASGPIPQVPGGSRKSAIVLNESEQSSTDENGL